MILANVPLAKEFSRNAKQCEKRYTLRAQAAAKSSHNNKAAPELVCNTQSANKRRRHHIS